MMRFELEPFVRPALLACGLAAAGPAMAVIDGSVHFDLLIGQTANKLAVTGVPTDSILADDFSFFSLSGWSADNPGLFEVGSTTDGISPLTPFNNNNIRLELVSFDPGFLLLEAGTLNVADEVGEWVSLGGGPVHNHPTWLIDDDVVGTGFEGTVSVTMKLVDGLGNYAESDPFSLSFTNVASVLGDLNGDGSLDNDDIAPFVMALVDEAGYAAAYPTLDPDELGDFNDSGGLTNADIYGFVDALTGGSPLTQEQSTLFEGAGLSSVPEPTSLAALGLGGLLLARRRHR